MATNRQDAWTQDEDLLLAEVVLRHIRNGGTQLQAFEEVGKQLSRTPAACGFRWNSYVRKQYKSGIELAKKERKERRRQGKNLYGKKEGAAEEAAQVLKDDGAAIPFERLVEFLKQLYDKAGQTNDQNEQIKQYKEKMESLEKKIASLTVENEKLQQELKMIEEDYRALIEIMERARKMVVLQDEEKQKVKFQMDKNGNLERVEK